MPVQAIGYEYRDNSKGWATDFPTILPDDILVVVTTGTPPDFVSISGFGATWSMLGSMRNPHVSYWLGVNPDGISKSFSTIDSSFFNIGSGISIFALRGLSPVVADIWFAADETSAGSNPGPFMLVNEGQALFASSVNHNSPKPDSVPSAFGEGYDSWIRPYGTTPNGYLMIPSTSMQARMGAPVLGQLVLGNSGPLEIHQTGATDTSVSVAWSQGPRVTGYELTIGAQPPVEKQGSFNHTATGLLPGNTYLASLRTYVVTPQADINIPISTISATGSSPGGEHIGLLIDGNNNSKWLVFDSQATVTFGMSGPVSPTGYSITSGGDAPERDPKSWIIEGSNDGVNWFEVDARTNELQWTSRNSPRSYIVANPQSAISYRWRITANQGGSIIQASEFKFSETQPESREYGEPISIEVATSGAPPGLPPVNDDFDNALPVDISFAEDPYVSPVINQTFATTQGLDAGFTNEDGSVTGEPGLAHTEQRSIWWKYQPTESGLATFDTLASLDSPGGSGNDTQMALYQVTHPDNPKRALTMIALDQDSGIGLRSKIVDFPVESGELYYIQVGHYSGTVQTRAVLTVKGPPSLSFSADLVQTGSTGTSIFLSWSDDSASIFDGYEVEIDGYPNHDAGKKFNCEFIGLLPGTIYEVTLRGYRIRNGLKQRSGILDRILAETRIPKRLTWTNKKAQYLHGVHRGVYYPEKGPGVVWNGLISVEEAHVGGDLESLYVDGLKVRNLPSGRNFQASVTAFSTPEGFEASNGDISVLPGLTLTRQMRSRFGMSYRVELGDGLGYKIHLVYNALATPTSRGYRTTNETPSPNNLAWTIDAVPVESYAPRPTAHFILDSTEIDKDPLAAVESLLYGTDTRDPYLPPINQIASIINEWDPQIIIPDTISGVYDLVSGMGDLQEIDVDGVYILLPKGRMQESLIRGLYTVTE